jgi:2-methylisocitrate lyase-like PEP mutase family enzyme
VDLERGYGRTVDEVIGLVRALIEMGVVGSTSRRAARTDISSPDELCARIAGIRALATERNLRLFINARTDAYFASKLDPTTRFEEALRRARL